MSKYSELFEFRLAKYEDIDSIMKFIASYWGNPNHILAVNREFFEYEFCHDDVVGFFMAVDKESKEIMAINAVYFYSKERIENQYDISGGMFLANPNCKVPFIGAELLKREMEQLKPRSYVSPGVNMRTSGPIISKFLRHDVRRMKHYYMLSDKENYVVAKIMKKKFSDDAEKVLAKCDLTQFYSFDEFERNFDFNLNRNRKPYKDKWYVEKRYFNHPVYKYEAYCYDKKMAIIGREVTVNDVTVFRIVDILGDVTCLGELKDTLNNIIRNKGYEYIDIYEIGMDDRILARAGFVERMENDENVIPNYFEPFTQCNVEIYAHRMYTDSFCFKADGDQDRPNRIS